MNRKEDDKIFALIEGLKSLLGNFSLEDFQQEVLRVESYLKRFGSLDELLSHLARIEKMAYIIKDYLTIEEVASYLQVSKSFVYKLTSARELTIYKPNGKNIFILRSDLDKWIKRNAYLDNEEIDKRANNIAYQLSQRHKLIKKKKK